MLSRYPLDPFDLLELPDVAADVHRPRPEADPRQELFGIMVVSAIAVASILLIAAALFTPILLAELARIESVRVASAMEPGEVFVDRLRTIFLGVLVVAAAIVSFVLAVVMTPRGPRVLEPLGASDIEAIGKERPRRGHVPGRQYHVRPL